jgi:DNA repair exonuclease SbcCD ATPase subunit
VSTIKLLLNNFCSHKKLFLQLPKTGLIKLDGVSGRGKTNVLKAILWAIWGSIDNVVNYEAKTCSVELDGLINGLNIRREKPNKLLVNGTSDGDMQAIIAEKLGMTEFEFEVSSYMSQSQRNSLVFCSPADQLDIFNKLALNGLDPEAVKDRAEDLLKKTEEDIAKDILALESFNNQISNSEILCQAYEAEIKELQPVEKPDEKRLLALDVQISRNKADIENCIRLINHPARNSLNKAQLAIDYAKGKIKEDENGLKIIVLKPIEEITAAQQAKVSFHSDINDFEKHLKIQEKVLDDVDNSLIVKKQLDENNNEFNILASEYIEKQTVDNLPKIEKLAKNLFNGWQSIKAQSNQEYRETAEQAVKSLQRNIQARKLSLNVAEAYLAENSTNIFNQKALLADIVKNNNAIKQAQEVVELNKSLAPVDVLNSKITELNTEIAQLQEVRAVLAKENSDYDNFIKTSQSNQKFKDKLAKEKGKIIELKQQFIDIETETNLNKAKQVADIKKFLAVLQKSNLIALEQLLQDLNEKIDKYIQQLFDFDISVKFTTQKEQINKKKVDKIQLVITENGLAIQKLNRLSGGQISRIALSTQLALSELFNSPILILDEATTGLDLENIEKVMLVLASFAKDKLVITVDHSVANGSVEQVFTI